MRKPLLVLFLFCGFFMFSLPAMAAVNFTDIAGNWAENDIVYIAEKGLIQGYEDHRFMPENKITRGELITILANDAKVNLSSYDKASGYRDVDSHWAKKAIVWGTSVGVVNGYADKTFGPDKNITRQELSVMIYRYTLAVSKIDLPQKNAAVTFNDDANIGSWAKTAVAKMQRAGIITGYGDGKFLPNNNATRAEAVTMLGRYVRIVNKEDAPSVGNNTIYSNGKAVGQVNVITEDGVSYVALRSFFEALGYRVQYYDASQLLVVCNHEKDMEMWLGKTKAFAKTSQVTLSAPPKLMNGSTYVALSDFGIPLGLNISFKAGQGIYVTHTATAVSLSALSFYGSASSGSAINGQINLGDTQGFFGTVANGQMRYGSYTLKNKTSYFGNWANGTFSGSGTMVNAFGDLSLGTFADGTLVNGTTFYSDGSYFSGEWYHCSDGSVYPSVGQYFDAGGKTYGSASSSWSNGVLRIN